MASGIGVLVAERIAAALVIDNQIAGSGRCFLRTPLLPTPFRACRPRL